MMQQEPPRKPKQTTWGQVSNGLYFFGTALVIGSWFNIVPARIGWMGWVLGMIGWIIPHYIRWQNDLKQGRGQ